MSNKVFYESTILLIVSGAAIASSIVAPCIPFIINSFKSDIHFTYFIVSIFLFGYLIGQIIHSFIAQIKGYKYTLLLGYLIYVISCFLQLISIKNGLISLFLCSRFLCAFGASSGLLCVFAMIGDHAEKNLKSQQLISKAFISLTFCSYLSITAGGFITEYLGWIFIFYIMPAISVIKLILIYYHIPQLPYHKNNSNFRLIIEKFVKSLSNFNFLSASFLVAVTTTSTYLYNTVASSISLNVLNLSVKYFGLASIINLICLLFGGCLSTKIIKKIGYTKTLCLGVTILFTPTTFLFVYYQHIFSVSPISWLFFTLAFVMNVGLGIIYPTASFIALHTNTCGSTASSIMNFLKIGCPAFTISILGNTQLSVGESYVYTMLIVSFIGIICTLYLKVTWKREIS